MRYSEFEIVLRSLAGLGLLFYGIKMVARNLSAMAGDQLRRGLQEASRGAGVATLFGVGAGFVTQSGRTTSFIMASFVQAGLIETRRALPIVLWANLGCTLVIFSAVIPIYLIALFFLSTAGVCIAFDKPRRWVNAASVAFGLALMIYGLSMTSAAAAVLTNYPWFTSIFAIVRISLLFALLAGLLLTFLAQSHIAILLITVTMAARGLLDFDQTLMMICGAHLGAGLITYVTGVHFRGQPRQLVTAQILYNVIGVALVLMLFAADHLVFGHEALIQRLCRGISSAPGADAAILAAFMNTLTPLILTLLIDPFQRLCQRLAPPLREEGLARPEFLRDEISGSPMATLLLAEREQLRLLVRLPIYLTWARAGAFAADGVKPHVYHDAFVQVSRCIESFQNALMSQRMTAEETEWLLNQGKRQEILAELDDICLEFHDIAITLGDRVGHLRDVILESMDTLLLTAISGMTHNNDAELDVLETMTSNRGPAMERMRGRYLAFSEHLEPAERSQVLQITNLFERLAWSLRRFGELLRASPSFALPVERPAPDRGDGAADKAPIFAAGELGQA